MTVLYTCYDTGGGCGSKVGPGGLLSFSQNETSLTDEITHKLPLLPCKLTPFSIFKKIIRIYPTQQYIISASSFWMTFLQNS